MGIFLIGCKDKPYQDEQSTQEKEYAISGTAELGNPISSATISIHEFKNLREGKKLAETTTNMNGSFETKLRTSYEGPILIKANGGSYKDLVSQENVPLKPKQELKTLLTDITMKESSNINAWTTLAVARVIADRGFWDPTIRQLGHIDRINTDFYHISKLLAGKSTNFINIRQQKSLDNHDDSSANNSKALFLMSHGGFSQLAKNFSERIDGYSITALDIILALVEDLSDRVFDGKNAAGQAIQIGKIQRVNINSQTMRKDFAEALLVYIRNNNDEKIRNYLNLLKQVASDIASDEIPELFPEKEKPKPIDTTPPKIFITFKGEYDSENPFGVMEGNVLFHVRATDDTKLEKIDVISPKIKFSKDDGTLGPIGINYPNDALVVADECHKRDELYKQLRERELNPNDVVCACFEASDIFGNTQKALNCFQREAPEASIDFPKSNQIITSRDFANGISMKATVKSGVALTSCSWKIVESSQIEADPQKGLKGEGTIDLNTCLIDAPLSLQQFKNGSYFLIIYAKDIYGRELSFLKLKDNKNVIPFEVAVTPPAVKFISPENGTYFSGKTINFVGSFTEANKIKSIVISYKGLSSTNINNTGSFNVPLSSKSDIWRAELGFDLPQGYYTVSLTVTDIFGNQETTIPREIEIDNEHPNIEQKMFSFANEITGYEQLYHNSNEPSSMDSVKPRYCAIVRDGDCGTQINSRKILTESRWSTELDDYERASLFGFRVTDNSRIKEVRYGINTTCVDWEQAKSIRQGPRDLYHVKIVQKYSLVNLLNDGEICLTVLASDFAGNISRHDKKIYWQAKIPPVSVHLNPAYFLKNRMNLSENVTDDGYLRPNAEIGYAVLINQFNKPLTINLGLKKSIMIILSNNLIGNALVNKINPDDIYVEYFEYDFNTDKVGEKLSLSKVVINEKSSIVAKFKIKNKIKFSKRFKVAMVESFNFIKFPDGYGDIQLTVFDREANRSATHVVHYPPYLLNQGEY